MNTITSILSKIPHRQHADQSSAGAFEPGITVIIVAQGDAPANLVRAHVVCAGMKTTGVIITPVHWQTPQDSGSKLWAPPDPMGWRIMDILTEAGVEEVEFWDRSGHNPE